MASKQDLIKKLDGLLKRSEELNQDLKDLSNLIFYSDFDTEQPKGSLESQKPVTPVTDPHFIHVEKAPALILPSITPDKLTEEKAKIAVSTEALKPFVLATPVTLNKPPSKPVVRKKTFFEKNPDLEKFIGERLITFIGIAILVTGIAFFVKFAIDQDWINETGRTFIGIICGGILLGFAHRLRKSFTTFSSILVGGGIAVLYFSISYSFQVYHLFSQTVAFALLIVITAFTVLLSLSYDRRELAVLAIIGGFSSPLMVANGGGNFPVLCTYILILNLGMLSLAYYRKWSIVNLVSYGFTILLFSGAVTMEMKKVNPAYIVALLFATSYYFTFFGMNVINNLKKKNGFGATEIITLLSNSFLYYGTGYYVLSHVHEGLFLGLFTVGVGVFNFLFAFTLYKRQEVDRNLVYFLIGLVLTFVSLAGPVQLHGSYITLFWAAEGVLLLWLFQRSKIVLIRYASLLVNFLMVISLVMDWMQIYGGTYLNQPEFPDVILNKACVTSLFALLSFGGTIFLLKKDKDSFIFGETFQVHTYRRIVSIVFLVVLYFACLWELLFQYNLRSGSVFGSSIVLALYNSIFVLSFMLVSRITDLAFLRKPATILGLIVMLLFFVFPHFAVIDARNSYLFNNMPGERFPFLLHFVNTALVVVLIFLTRQLFFSFPEVYKSFREAFSWVMCILLVFAGSAEMDHFFILNAYNTIHPGPGYALELSHKIGYPILWGIFSFVIMLFGMRKRNRQLRIISLSLFFLAIVKLISLGIYGESEGGKIIAFISSGVILLVVAFMYQKLKKLFVEDDVIETAPENEAKTI
jgi:uncharacterized membrane protein